MAFDAGTVIKYAAGAMIDDWGPVTWDTSAYRPAMMTAVDDNAAGETISGSTGAPSGFYASYALCMEYGTPGPVHDVRIAYAQYGLYTPGPNTARDCQFVNVGTAISWFDDVQVENCLFANVDTAFGGGSTVGAVNVTAHDIGTLFDSTGTLSATNCLFVVVTNWGGAVTMVNSATINSDTGLFQSGPLGDHYLSSDSPFIDAGNTTADRLGLYDFTTQPNQTIEGITTVDLGYHYLALDADCNPVSTLVSGVPDYISDSNGNGLPDAWETNYFGNLNHFATDLDSQDNTLLSDYQSGRDPNIIQFSVEVANNYVNNSNPDLQLDVTAGAPFSYAVLTDSTNFDTANWTAFNSSNVTANLGAIEGWHELWIGLKGCATNATVTWQWKRLKLDFTPPLLVITNPVSGLVMQPMIELQGYSPEELSSISFDLTNAAGWFTNQQVLVLDRHYDTNTWEFTTNTFQGFDIPLTNGLNTLTLHATDLAGNATNLTLNFTLDYSGKTNPPVVELYWPQSGAQICGSSFTWRGHVDDFTAQLTAQIVDADGNTNVVNTLVERDGDFWAENLPLSTGANELTLTATDAAGNSSTTNITVVQSAVTLTMNDVPGDQLWNSFVTASGTISDPDNYTIWVNGVKAALNGTAWEADNVPTTPGGTAVFQARAIPTSDNGGNGTGGSGGTAASYANPGNPYSVQAHDADSQTDKPMRLYVESYSYSESCDIHPSGAGYGSDGHQTYSFQINDACTWTLDWTDGGGGKGSEANSGDTTLSGTAGGDVSSWADSDADQWPASFWPDLVDGTGAESYSVTHNGQTSSGSWSGEVDPPHVGEDGWPAIAFEHCQVQGSNAGSANHSDGHGGYKTSKDQVNFTRTADTVMKLFTGGKAGLGRQNIFALSATAQRPRWMALKPNLLDDSVWYEYELPPTLGPWDNIDSTQIKIDGKPLGANGVAYFAWEDGITKDVTPKVEGVDYYTFSEPTPAKYTLIHQTEHLAFSNKDRNRTTIGVGEDVDFSGMPGNTTWSARPGTVSANEGSATVFTAPDTGGNAIVAATVGDVTLTTSFGVLEPSDVKFSKSSGDKHLQGYTSAGFLAAMQLEPTSVSFYAVQTREDSCSVSGSGAWPAEVGNHPQGGWVGVDDDNFLGWPDHVASILLGIVPGGYTWAIPWRYHVSSGDGYQFQTVNHVFSADTSGTATQSKHGVTTAAIPISAPSTDWPF